mmetsp:Transcript_41206/g.92184  ORF Transcript_41206/g.92184 Transcript_41206/m.92184 type:complete len:339 (-) Transcript_41206:97-1113(-)
MPPWVDQGPTPRRAPGRRTAVLVVSAALLLAAVNFSSTPREELPGPSFVAPGVRHGLGEVSRFRRLSRAADAEDTDEPLPDRPELPNSTEVMCRQAAEAVMRAYRDGYTRQAVRLRLDAAYEGQENLAELLKATLPLAKSFTSKLWKGEYLRAIKTSLVDEDVTTLLYREAENALMDSAVLYLPSREVVTSPKFNNFFRSMGDRLVVVANTENAAANWRVENMGADFYDTPDAGLEICKAFSQQSYYYQLVPLNNWQVTFFHAYPFPWELWIEDLNYNLVKLGESPTKPSYEQITEWTEAYEERAGIKAFEKVGKLLQDKQQKLTPDEAASLALGGAS